MNLRLRRWLSRIERIASFAAIAIPLAVSLLLGFAWLVEHGWIFHFVFLSSGLALIALCIRLWKRRAPKSELTDAEIPLPNAEWGPNASAAYRTGVRLIEARTKEQLAWSDLQTVALEVIHTIAAQSHQKGRNPLSFTLPEALLLTERVSLRFRADLKRNLPFADKVSLEQVLWVWRNRERGQRIWDIGQQGWRIFRFFRNPALATVQELDRALGGGNTTMLQGEAIALLQSMILEEVARTATDLYFGYLRLTGSELDEARTRDAAKDTARLAPPDLPLRIAVVGQTSAGKSSLINALLKESRAEADLPATTQKGATYLGRLGTQEVMLLDLPGLESATHRATLEALKEADMVIWAIKTNRPAKEPDRALFADWQAWAEAHPDRRRPPLFLVATWVDAILTGWTPGEPLGALEQNRLSQLISHISDALGPAAPSPLPVVLTEPQWNIDTLTRALSEATGEALMVQRNRARLSEHNQGWRTEISRAGRGLVKSAQLAAEGLKRRHWDDPE